MWLDNPLFSHVIEHLSNEVIMATKRMEESWERIKMQIRNVWGEDISDSELDKGRRDLNKMVDIIHKNTGEARAKIRGQMSAIL